MNYIAALAFILFFGLFSGQNKQEFIFEFNAKKWQKEFKKFQKNKDKGTSIIHLFDINGRKIAFDMQEKSISEIKLKDIIILKGQSLDHTKTASLTVLPKSMSGSYLDNGVQYFIEPVKGTCNKYKVYTSPAIDKSIQVGQENDYIK